MDYTELEPLASGGMGTVSLCVGRGVEGFQRIYAMKRIHAELARDPEFREMFVEEAKLAAAVRHANVVSVLDVGEDRDGVYLVMEYIEGVSLSTMLRELARRGRRLPLQVAVRVLRDVAEGLLAVHSATDEHGRPLEIVHRDVSPQNVLVGFDGVARLADFGVAKAAYLSGRTASGVMKGKLGYAAPEQLRFEPVDHRCDLFSMGVVCWETLTSRRLYQGREGARSILHEPPPDLAEERDVPDELAALLFWLLAKDPSARPESAEPVIEALERIVASCVAEEGAVDVRSFVRAHFEESRLERRERIRTKLETLGASEDELHTASLEVEDEAASFDADEVPTRLERLDPPVAEPPVAEPPVAEPPVAEPSVAEPSVAEPSADPRREEPGSPRKRRAWVVASALAAVLVGGWFAYAHLGDRAGVQPAGPVEPPEAVEPTPDPGEEAPQPVAPSTRPEEPRPPEEPTPGPSPERAEPSAPASTEGRSRPRASPAASEGPRPSRGRPASSTPAVEAPVSPASSGRRAGDGVVVDMTAAWEWE